MSLKLMTKAFDIRVGNHLRKLVLIKLADNASDQGECWPSYGYIANQCECSKSAVREHIAALIELGLVSKENRLGGNAGKGNKSNVYRLHLENPVPSESTPPMPHGDTPMPSHGTPVPSESTPPMPHGDTPMPSLGTPVPSESTPPMPHGDTPMPSLGTPVPSESTPPMPHGDTPMPSLGTPVPSESTPPMPHGDTPMPSLGTPVPSESTPPMPHGDTPMPSLGTPVPSESTPPMPHGDTPMPSHGTPVPSESTPPMPPRGTRICHSFEPVKEPVIEPNSNGTSAKAAEPSRTGKQDYSPEFETAWQAYPKRSGGNPKPSAWKAWSARIREGVKPADMLAGVQRYAGYITATGKAGTEYVKQAATFFGPDHHFTESWTTSPSQQRTTPAQSRHSGFSERDYGTTITPSWAKGAQ
ncbi:helix-turn-helix domain-containing protein [Pantoea dispersa]|uniref:helix-turn-helix domain-containing protein n=1 Tax=Pantoea dispersa TaxID=59814 RepID=UPI001F0BBB63|nr:helix-turn-helix domain-containing protein [Pantoea dispersa]